MNYYVVVEGSTEKTVYKAWIPLVNPKLITVDFISQVDRNNCLIVNGGGYPNYFEVIARAIEDINDYGIFDRLVISVDSEDMTRQEKLIEIKEYLANKKCSAETYIIIQHFCFETWALGNRRIIRPFPQSRTLRTYKKYFNVRVSDPELLPDSPDENLTRAQFALKYLKVALKDKYRKLYYSKSSPHPVCYYKYFDQVKARLNDTGHINSFESFLNAFR